MITVVCDIRGECCSRRMSRVSTNVTTSLRRGNRMRRKETTRSSDRTTLVSWIHIWKSLRTRVLRENKIWILTCVWRGQNAINLGWIPELTYSCSCNWMVISPPEYQRHVTWNENLQPCWLQWRVFPTGSLQIQHNPPGTGSTWKDLNHSLHSRLPAVCVAGQDGMIA